MSDLDTFMKKWEGILSDPDLPQPLKSIAEFVKKVREKEVEK